MNTRIGISFWLLAALHSPAIHAADALQGGAPLNGAAGLVKVVLALALILAMIFAFGWFVRRFGLPGKAQQTGLLSVIDSTHIGPRERVVLISAGEHQILVGITPTGMTRLAEFDAKKNGGFSDTLNAVDATESQP